MERRRMVFAALAAVFAPLLGLFQKAAEGGKDTKAKALSPLYWCFHRPVMGSSMIRISLSGDTATLKEIHKEYADRVWPRGSCKNEEELQNRRMVYAEELSRGLAHDPRRLMFDATIPQIADALIRAIVKHDGIAVSETHEAFSKWVAVRKNFVVVMDDPVRA